MPRLPMIGIDYDDSSQDTYEAIELELPGQPPQRFATGDPSVDHRAALRRYFEWLAEHGVEPLDGTLMERSSMNHFGMDGKAWTYENITLEDVPAAGGQRYDIEVEAIVRARP